MKIAIFSPYSLPELGACSLRVDSLKRFFERNGIVVKVFSPERANMRKGRAPEGYVRYKGLEGAFVAAFKGDFDVILGTSPPLTHSFVALIAAKLRCIPFVADLRDPWTHEYEGLGIYTRMDPRLWGYKLMEALAYNLSDRVFVVTETIGRIASRFTLDKSKILLVSNGSDPKLFRRDAKKGKAMRKSLGIPEGAKVAIYAGAFVKKDLERMIEELADTIKRENAYLLFVIQAGKAEAMEFEKLKGIVRSSGIAKKTRFVNSGGFGFEKLNWYYSASDFGLDPLPKGMGDYCIPVKTYDFFFSELPIVGKGEMGGELENLIVSDGLGFFATNWDGFREKFLEALHSDKLKKIGILARQIALKKFDREHSNWKALVAVKDIVKQSDL